MQLLAASFWSDPVIPCALCVKGFGFKSV